MLKAVQFILVRPFILTNLYGYQIEIKNIRRQPDLSITIINNKDNNKEARGLQPTNSSLVKLASFLLLVISTVIPMAAIAPVTAGDSQTSEYQLKAAYLLNLAKFIQWPAEESQATDSPFSFCLIGVEKHVLDIEKEFTDKIVHGRPVTSRHIGFADTTETCQVLFVGSIGDTRLSHVLKHGNRSNILVVGESPNFIPRGGDINFFVEPNRLRFEINPLSLRHKGMTISSKLLRLARILEVPVQTEAE